MITNTEIKEAVTAIIGPKKQKIKRTEVFDIISKVLTRAGFYADGFGPISRTGRLDRLHRQLVLVSPEVDGFKLLPLIPGQEIELLVDGVWTRARVQMAADGGGLTKQKLNLPDDTPVFGVYARVPMALDGSTLPAFLSAGRDPGKIEVKKNEKKGDFSAAEK